jgi:hypothetical protein
MNSIFGRRNGEVREKQPRDLDLRAIDFAPPEQRHAERAVAELKGGGGCHHQVVDMTMLADDMASRIERIKAIVLKLTWGEMDEMCAGIAKLMPDADLSSLPAILPKIMHRWASQ